MDAFEFDLFLNHHLLSLPSSAPRSFFRSNAPSPSKDWSGWKLYFRPDLFFWNNVKYRDLWFITKLPCCPRREYAGRQGWMREREKLYLIQRKICLIKSPSTCTTMYHLAILQLYSFFKCNVIKPKGIYW